MKEIRKTMRIQALRCHVLYSHDGSKLNIIPVLASRSQALRSDCYLNVFLSFLKHVINMTISVNAILLTLPNMSCSRTFTVTSEI